MIAYQSSLPIEGDLMAESLKIFVGKGCEPCREITRAIDKGLVDVDGLTITQAREADIEVIDIASDEGFPLVQEYDLDNVPSAYYGKRRCEILLGDRITIDCSESPPDQDR